MPTRYEIPTLTRDVLDSDNLEETSAPNSLPRVDDIFNFETIVFQVEKTYFTVLKNSFNVAGTIFEAMFALPSTGADGSLVEGSSPKNPIHLREIKEDHFRAFLRILYPLSFIDQSRVLGYDDWVGVLNLATMWEFKEIRLKAIDALDGLIKQKTVLERISWGRKCRVPQWVIDGYTEIVQRRPLTLEELRNPPEFALDWETIARIYDIRNTAPTLKSSRSYCYTCAIVYGLDMPNLECACPAPASLNVLGKVDEVFRVELDEMKDIPDQQNLPLPG